MNITNIIKLPLIVVLSCLLLSASNATQNSVRVLSSVPQISKVPKKKVAEVVTFLQTKKLTAPFYPKSSTGCFCDMAYDPLTGMKFINLDRGPRLGVGYYKVVTTAIRYNSFRPEIVAFADQVEDKPIEKKMTRYVQGMPHVIKVYGFADYEKKGQRHYAMYSKYYHQGSLLQALWKKKTYRFTVREKIEMARQMIQAIEALHQHKIVHRDIKLSNFLLDIKGRGKNRRLDVVLADFEAARFENEVARMRAHADKEHFSPEGILRPLKAEEFYAGDIFALGTSLHWLLNEKKPIWAKECYFMQSNIPAITRYKNFVRLLDQEVVTKRLKLIRKSRSEKLTQEERFLLIIYQMLLPDPQSRGTATSLRKQLDSL